MEATIQKVPWWPLVLAGLALLAGGIIALIWPDVTLIVFVILWGSVTLVNGLIMAVAGIFARGGQRWFLLFTGVILAAIGAAILAWPDITALVVLYMIGGWAMIAGVLLILGAMFRPQERKADKWMLVFSGMISLAMGAVILAWPESTAVAIIWLIAIYAILFGILLIVSAFSVRKSNA